MDPELDLSQSDEEKFFPIINTGLGRLPANAERTVNRPVVSICFFLSVWQEKGAEFESICRFNWNSIEKRIFFPPGRIAKE